MALATLSEDRVPTGADNVVEFPIGRRRDMKACPHCGTRTDLWRIGRLLWAYCESHEVRWVAADFRDAAPSTLDRERLRKGLEFLASFAEVSN